LEEVLKVTAAGRNAYFWATHGGAELDLLITEGLGRIGVEFKYSLQPTMTKSMHTAINDLRLNRLAVVYPGSLAFPLGNKAEAVPLSALGKWFN